MENKHTLKAIMGMRLFDLMESGVLYEGKVYYSTSQIAEHIEEVLEMYGEKLTEKNNLKIDLLEERVRRLSEQLANRDK